MYKVGEEVYIVTNYGNNFKTIVTKVKQGPFKDGYSVEGSDSVFDEWRLAKFVTQSKKYKFIICANNNVLMRHLYDDEKLSEDFDVEDGLRDPQTIRFKSYINARNYIKDNYNV